MKIIKTLFICVVIGIVLFRYFEYGRSVNDDTDGYVRWVYFGMPTLLYFQSIKPLSVMQSFCIAQLYYKTLLFALIKNESFGSLWFVLFIVVYYLSMFI